MGILEVKQKTNKPVPPQVQVKPLFQDVGKKDVIQKTNLPVPPQVQVKCFSNLMFIVEVMQLQKTNQVQVKLPLLEGRGVQTEVINLSVGMSNQLFWWEIFAKRDRLIDCRKW
jgi:hypothetical protein